jgi:FixJ family two-component response regulator
METKGTQPGKHPTGRKVLVVDDQDGVREALRLLLKGAGYVVETVSSPNEALAAVTYRDLDLIVMDMNYTSDTTSGEEGLRLLDKFRDEDESVPVIAMTGWSTIELAVEAMWRGACDFIPKPWDNRHVLAVIQKHLNAPAKKPKLLESEIEIARKVQRKLLPEPRFTGMGLECECASVPVSEVAGDLYDFFETGPDKMSFLLGDVCGKGLGAALLVANLQATIRAQYELAASPSKLMTRVNSLFFQCTRPEHFATLFFGAYESGTRILRYVNCGHPAPVLIRANGSLELLHTTATVLGAFDHRSFEEKMVQLVCGDRLILFSDGFSECELAGENGDWAVETIRSVAADNPTALAGRLVSLAASQSKPVDDVTVMVLQIAE